MGTDAQSEATLTKRLEAGLPTLFWLWTPHQRLGVYNFTRMQLPRYTEEGFDQGKTDYPQDVLEKVAAKTLEERAPRVHRLLSQFKLRNEDQEEMMARLEKGVVSLFETACIWLRNNTARWTAWVPDEDLRIQLALLIPLTGWP